METSPLMNANSGRGIGAYTRELLKALRALSSDEFPLRIQATHELGHTVIAPENDFDLIHYPYFDLFFSTLPAKHELPVVVTVHDVIPLLYPKHYPPGIKGRLRFWKQKQSLQQAQLIITDSFASKDGIVKHLGIPANRVRVIPLAGNPAITEPADTSARRWVEQVALPKKYIVYVGDINYNKNLPTLLLALTQLPQDVHLVVISRSFQNTAIAEGQQLAKIIEENEIEPRVHVLQVPGDEPEFFSSILQQSVALIQPSLWEGFGLPVLEAMQAGAVVVSTDGGSLPEVVGDAAIMVEPTLIGIVTGIEKALTLRGEKRQELIEAGRKQVSKFSWEMTAKQTYQAYQTARDTWKQEHVATQA
jgi:glycosyltransferase involved in cell wall biosynthesis